MIFDANELFSRINSRTASIGVIGLGYVGLPLAHAFGRQDFIVTGFDIDFDRVEGLCRGKSYLGHFASSNVEEMIARGFEATCDLDRTSTVDALMICVPTPLTPTREPDL